MDRNALIGDLVNDLSPVKRLPPPGVRASAWLGAGFVLVALVTAVYGANVETWIKELSVPRFAVEEFAILATAVAAAWAAFELSVPGASRWWNFVPLIPLGVWLAMLAQGCIADYLEIGVYGLRIAVPYACFPPTVLIGTLPMAAMVIMLRRGTLLAPRWTLALAGIAVAALANLGVRLVHAGDASVMILVWNFGLVVVLSTVAGWLGPAVLSTRATPIGRHRA